MPNRSWIISDTHFGHALLAPLRGFSSVEEMDEALVANWNAKIAPSDRVYHLGDVCIKRKSLEILAKLHGRKVLLKGNHDIFKLKDYVPYFDDIRAYRVFPVHNLILSHIPIATEQLRRFGVNGHGHTHEYDMIDPRYINLCVEKTQYAPVLLDEILLRAKGIYEKISAKPV